MSVLRFHLFISKSFGFLKIVFISVLSLYVFYFKYGKNWVFYTGFSIESVLTVGCKENNWHVAVYLPPCTGDTRILTLVIFIWVRTAVLDT